MLSWFASYLSGYFYIVLLVPLHLSDGKMLGWFRVYSLDLFSCIHFLDSFSQSYGLNTMYMLMTPNLYLSFYFASELCPCILVLYIQLST